MLGCCRLCRCWLHGCCYLSCCTFQLKGVPGSQLTTKLLEDPHHVAGFAAFLVARGVAASTLVKHICTIRKVLVWRQSLAKDAAQAAKLLAVIRWVDVLQKQCPNAAMPSQAPLQHSKLPHAKEVLALGLRVEKLAAQMAAADITRWGQLTRPATAQALQDAAQLAMMSGYLPPLRLGCVRSCLHPDGVQPSGGCMDTDCRQGNNCQGNRLEWVDSSKSKLKACFPHHKNEGKWDHMPIEFVLPPSLTKQLMPWITKGHSILAAPGQRLLFIHPPTGMQLSNVNLAQVSTRLSACMTDGTTSVRPDRPDRRDRHDRRQLIHLSGRTASVRPDRRDIHTLCAVLLCPVVPAAAGQVRLQEQVPAQQAAPHFCGREVLNRQRGRALQQSCRAPHGQLSGYVSCFSNVTSVDSD